MSAAPPEFTPRTSFSTLAQQPITTAGLPGSQLDGEFSRAADSINQIRSRLSEVQRDDGKLRNGVVNTESLSEDVRNLFIASGTRPVAWTVGGQFATGDFVSNPPGTPGTYLCIVPHTSSSLFVSDLSKWALIATPPTVGFLYTNTFTGNGTTTSFSLSNEPASINNTQLFIDGIYQPKGGYSISGNVLTITPAPDDGSEIEVSIGVPSNNTTVTVTDGAISTVKIETSAVTTPKIAALAVTNEKLADGAISLEKIVNSAVSTDKLANGSVTNAKIAQGSITSEKLVNQSITSEKIAPLSVSSDKLSNSIPGSKLADISIASEKIKDGAITSAKLASSLSIGSLSVASISSSGSVSAGLGIGSIDANVLIGYNRTAAGTASIYFYSDAGTTIEASIQRTSGTNGDFKINNVGTGDFTNTGSTRYGYNTASPVNTHHFVGGIRYTSPNAAGSGSYLVIDSNGDIKALGSSLRYKNSIEDYGKGLEDIKQLRPVTYKFNGEDVVTAGFIAEEVDAIGMGEYVVRNSEGKPDALNYGQMVALLVNGIKDLSAKVEELEKKIQ